MTQATYRIECAVSGVGFDHEGTITTAVETARQTLRHPSWANTIWLGSVRVAKVWQHHEWIASESAITHTIKEQSK